MQNKDGFRISLSIEVHIQKRDIWIKVWLFISRSIGSLIERKLDVVVSDDNDNDEGQRSERMMNDVFVSIIKDKSSFDCQKSVT